MKNNELFKEMFVKIQKAHYILIVTHKNPDVDTLSCALSLSNYFFENKIKHKVFNISDNLPLRLNFLSKYDKIVNKLPKYYDLIIHVDCANEQRVGIEFSKEIDSICIDHHDSNTFFADINIIDETKGSTSELLYNFYKSNKLEISKQNAECLYTGIYDDTNALTESRTNTNTFSVLHSLMECKINVSYISNNLLKRESLSRFRLLPKIMNTLDLYYEGQLAIIHVQKDWISQTGNSLLECDDVVDMVLCLGIVNIVAYCRPFENQTRVSLRSKGAIDTSIIAKKFNGGGHKNRAGCTLNILDIKEVKEELIETIGDYISS